MKTKSITDINNQVIHLLGNLAFSNAEWEMYCNMSAAEQRSIMAKRTKRITTIKAIQTLYYQRIICSEEYKRRRDEIERKSGVKNLPWDCSRRNYLERCNRNEFNRIQIPIDTYRGVSKTNQNDK